MRIAIIGAGIGGLTLALALRRFGLEATIYDQVSALGEVGAGITLFPNANRVMFHLGLEQAFDDVSVEPEAQKIFHYETAEPLQIFPRGEAMRAQFGYPLYQLHRRDLHDILVAAVTAEAPDSIVLNHRVAGVEPNDGGASVIFVNGSKVTADLVVGCDGIRSAVRESLFGKEEPLFTNVIAWRALVPFENLTPELRREPTVVHTGPDSNVAHYLVRNKTLMNYLCFAVVDTWAEEGWRITGRLDDVVERFKGYNSMVRDLIAATPPDTLFKWGLFDRDVRPQWSDGAVTLLGDAAHPMLPFLGQGAGMVIEDAMVLARAVHQYPSLPEALERYENARRPRTEYTMLKSREHGRYYNSHPEDADGGNVGIDVDRLLSYDAVTVPL